MRSEEQERFLLGLEKALGRITNPRYYETERGYQGALIAELQKELEGFNWDRAIIEQEYQKRIRDHGTRVRPDLIIHVPFDSNSHNTRGEGNFVVFELKYNSKKDAALCDFDNLATMCNKLNYPLAVFINISSTTTHIENYEGENKDLIVAYRINLDNETVLVTREQ